MVGVLIDKIREKRARLVVIGLGHVGLPVSAIFANAGYPVIGVDAKNEVVDAISSLRLNTCEERLDELVSNVVRSGKLKTTNDTIGAVKQSDVALICVQTPLTESGKPDLSFLKSATLHVAKGLAKEKLVIVVSTVPPGTVKNLVANTLEKKSGLKRCSEFSLAYSPERILPGNSVEELIQNARLVGGIDSVSLELTSELFRNVIKGRILSTTIENAELAKLAENTFRFVNIAFANELALMCEKMGADIVEVTNLANTHPRVNIHNAGPGVGGPCLTKDPQLLTCPEGLSPFESKLIPPSKELNDYMGEHLVEFVVEALRNAKKNVKGACVAVLGAAYKGEVSDTTNSPAEKIVHELRRLGMEVRVYDPYTKEDFGAKHANSIEEAVKGTDCVAVITDHKIFASLPLKELKALMNKDPVIVDGKRIINSDKANKEGFTYYGIGVGLKHI